MKLNLLEDGVLDYKGRKITLATPAPIPAGSLGAGVKPAPQTQPSRRLRGHLKDCPVCSTGKLCEFGERLASI
jgi:hypothetical protein